MKLHFLALLSFSIQQPAFSQHIDIPVLISRPIDTVYAPAGFDDNDNVEVILHGHYESSCYANGPVSAHVDAENKTILIKAESYFHIGSPCRQMKIPFIQPVKLGMLKSGSYSIRVEANSNTQLTPLVIKAAETESQDDYMYPSITAAFITVNESGRQSLNLNGHFPKVSIGCLVMKNVKLTYTPGKVLVVQPIMELRDGWVCNTTAAQPFFSYSRELDVNLDSDELIHVRSASGDSLNSLTQAAFR